jgi:hypothetical protein
MKAITTNFNSKELVKFQQRYEGSAHVKAKAMPRHPLYSYPLYFCVLLALLALPAKADESDQVRQVAGRYMIGKYRIDPKFLKIDDVTRAGSDWVVTTRIEGSLTYELTVDPRIGQVITENAYQGHHRRSEWESSGIKVGVGQGRVVLQRGGRTVAVLRTQLPNVEKWKLIDDDQKIVIKSRGNHGPAAVELFDTRDGQLRDKVLAFAIHDGEPEWAPQGFED